MDNIFSRLLPTRITGMDKAVVGKADPNKDKTGIPITVAIFFDGTGNNRNNVAQRLIAEHNAQHPENPVDQDEGVPWSGSYDTYGKDKKGKPLDNSFAAGYSNVSTLEKLNTRRDLTQKDISIYVEGIGTTDNQADSTISGGGLGLGDTGIKAKVTIGIGKIADNITKVMKDQEDSFVEKITIYVFGFSRGAAAARHCYMISGRWLRVSAPRRQRSKLSLWAFSIRCLRGAWAWSSATMSPRWGWHWGLLLST
jgi:hypothetical protein